MPTATDLTAMTILAAGIAAADIARVAQQLVPTDILPVQQPAVLAQRPHEQWASASQQPDPDIEAGRRWIERQSAERERDFREQQRQRGEDRWLHRLERRSDADRRLPQSWDARSR